MENVTKALLIAAAMFFVVLIVTVSMIAYGRISSHYSQQQDLIAAEQLDEFNKQFQNYNRKDIRGNELISLMNKIIDYNTSQAYYEEKQYERIKVEIIIEDDTVPDGTITEQFKYDNEGTTIIEDKITNTEGIGDNYAKDKQLVYITGTPSRLITDASQIVKADTGTPLQLTDTYLQKLTAEISNIAFNDDGENSEEYRPCENRRNRAVLLRNILGLNIERYDKIESPITQYDIIVEEKTYKTRDDNDGKEKIEIIKDIVREYYQYTQFKRACFECTELIHDPETGRVIEMNFKVQTDDSGNVVFD